MRFLVGSLALEANHLEDTVFMKNIPLDNRIDLMIGALQSYSNLQKT